MRFAYWNQFSYDSIEKGNCIIINHVMWAWYADMAERIMKKLCSGFVKKRTKLI